MSRRDRQVLRGLTKRGFHWSPSSTDGSNYAAATKRRRRRGREVGVHARLSKRSVAMCPSIRPSHARQHQQEHVIGCRMNERARRVTAVFNFSRQHQNPLFRKRKREDGERYCFYFSFPLTAAESCYNNRTNVPLGLRPLCGGTYRRTQRTRHPGVLSPIFFFQRRLRPDAF